MISEIAVYYFIPTFVPLITAGEIARTSICVTIQEKERIVCTLLRIEFTQNPGLTREPRSKAANACTSYRNANLRAILNKKPWFRANKASYISTRRFENAKDLIFVCRNEQFWYLASSLRKQQTN